MDPTEWRNYSSVRWHVRLAAEDRLPIEVLHRDVPEVRWDRIQASGVGIAEPDARLVARAWQAHLDRLGTHSGSADEVGATETFVEGAATEITVNRYERDPKARAACIAHWGSDCAVCGFNFEDRDGDLGKGFVHVHHVVDLASVGGPYKVDPVKDLRPVCPNCHAMLHRERPAMTVAALKQLTRTCRSKNCC